MKVICCGFCHVDVNTTIWDADLFVYCSLGIIRRICIGVSVGRVEMNIALLKSKASYYSERALISQVLLSRQNWTLFGF